MYKRSFIYLLFIIFFLNNLAAQDINTEAVANTATNTINEVVTSRSDAINVFLDCSRCDRNYLRETISFVNYVNNRDEADVFIMMTRRNTGSGGSEHIIAFTGLGEYQGMTDTLTYFSTPNQSGDETRRAHANIIAMGLMRFVALTPMAQDIRINYGEPLGRGRGPGRGNGASRVVEDDPWNSWVFELSVRGSYDKDENYENVSSNNNFSANRVTEGWKSEFDARYDYRQRNLTKDGVTYKFPRESWRMSTLQVKSLGPHFSAGGRVRASSSTFGNTKFAFEVHPALEYNVFPYNESFKRQIRVQYTVEFNYVDYMDTTMYFQVNEMIYQHQLSVAVAYNQPWGSGNFSIRGSHHLDDASFWSFRMNGRINWRIYRGLSVSFNAEAAIIRDDKAILKGGVSFEDALMQIQRLNSGYSYSMGFGLSYSFGSIYNNVVNPRFTGR